MELQLRQIKDRHEVDAVGRLRAEVWRDEDGISFDEFGDSDCWTDDFDPSAYHWAVYDGTELVAAARLSLHTSVSAIPYGHAFLEHGVAVIGKVASINRLVVKKTHRGLGIARALDRARLEKARELGATVVMALPVGPRRAAALRQLGYVSLAENLDPQGVHIPLQNAKLGLMIAPLSKVLAATPSTRRELQATANDGPLLSEPSAGH